MSISIGSLLQRAKKVLYQANLSSYSLDAELILADVLASTREHVIIHPNEPVSHARAKEFLLKIKHRTKHEPISHILKKRDFWRSSFVVNEHVLDPRPSSETLIEQALLLYKNKSLALRVLDLGSGSGCLLLSLLAEYRNAYGIGIEKSQRACFVARTNAARLGLQSRALFLPQSWNFCHNPGIFAHKLNLIISNPPYIQSSHLMRYEVSKHEPRLALNGGAGGLVCYRQIFLIANQLLKFRGFLVVEIGQHQYVSICRLAKYYGFEVCGNAEDLSGIVRCVTLRKTNEV